MVILGIGAGTLFPNLSGAAVASAPGESFATATSMNSVARQVGAALGVALVIAIIGTPTPLTVLSVFRDAWTFGAVCLFAAGLGCVLVGAVAVDKSPGFAEAARAVLATNQPEPPVRAPLPRAPRAITADAAAPPAPRAESAADFLARVPIFSGVDPRLRAQLAATMRTRRVEAGEWLFREGDEADALFVVRAGRLEVVDEAADVVIRELGRGDETGELALLTGSPRSASVRAVRTSDVVAVDRDAFDEVLRSSPELSLALTRTLARQLRDTRAPAPATRPRPTTVALVALGEPTALRRIVDALASALRSHLSVTTLTGEEIAPPPAGTKPATVYGPLLDRAEVVHDMVLLAGDSALRRTPWTEFCLQQADRILAVTTGGPVPDGLGDIAEIRGCDLVVLDEAVGRLEGWAAALDPIESHLIRTNEFEADIARSARRLAGTSVGIVLSGGGARAFSHIGVLEELSASGLTIDRVAGVSMGAVIGALFAMGLDADEIDAICFDEWVQRRPLSDYTLPRHSLIRGERFRSMLHRTFGSRLIEELPRSFMSGSTELRSGRLVIARRGPLWEAVGFSICLPVIAPPQVRGREMYIDGSLVDNLPVRTMAEMGEGPIIAVDVKASFERAGNAARPANGRVASAVDGVGQPRRDRERPPRLGETLTRVLLLGSENTSEAAGRHADLVIKPRASGVGLLEFHQIDAAREAGRVAAREALERAPAALFT